MTELKLPTKPYCKDCREYNLSKIVDEKGNNAGMYKLIEGMVKATPDRVQHVLGAEVVRLHPTKSGFIIVLANGSETPVESVILAMAQQPLMTLLHSSRQLEKVAADTGGLPNFRALHRIRASPAMKLYLLYEDAWWRNELNLTQGTFNNSAATENQTSGTPVPQFPPMVGRYHDGDVRCDPHCRGFLETTYAFDDVSLAFFRPYRAGTQPYVRLGEDPDDVAGNDLLDIVHEELVRFHAHALAKVSGALARTKKLRPSMALLAIWDEATTGFGGAIHDWFRDSRGNATCSSFEVCQQVMPPRFLQPFPKVPLFLAGEAFGSRNGWSESAMAMAENVLAHHFGLDRPEWIDEKTYTQKVLYNMSGTTPSDGRFIM